MGVTEQHTAVDSKAGDWPAELHFRNIRHPRRRRGQSPAREVSPVPSYYSEPVSVRQRKDVTIRLPPLIRGAHHQEEEDDEEDTQSLKSLPTVMSTLAFSSKVKRSHRHPKEHVISGLNLPPLITSKPSKPESSGTQHVHATGHPPNAPLGDNHFSEKTLDIKGNCQLLSSSSAIPEAHPGPRNTFHSPVVQAVYPITPDTSKETRQTTRTHQPPRPVWKKSQLSNRGAFHFLLEDSYFPCPGEPHLLEPISGFQEHLRRQILNSPLPCNTTLPQVHSHCYLQQRDCPHPGPYDSTVGRTVELCNLQGRRLPKITMTCPTPSPKHLYHTEKRHVA